MTPDAFVAPNRESSASERAIPVVDQPARTRVSIVYEPPEATYVSYEITPRPSFDLRIKRAERGYWLVWDAVTGVFGEGDSPLEAAEDFERTAVEHLGVLEEDSDDLPEGQRWQLDYLRTRIRR